MTINYSIQIELKHISRAMKQYGRKIPMNQFREYKFLRLAKNHHIPIDVRDSNGQVKFLIHNDGEFLNLEDPLYYE